MEIGSAVNRRSFLSYAVGMLAVPAVAQKAIIENGRAVVCQSDSLTCPACKQKTCPNIDAPLMVGNDNRNYPDSSQLFDVHVVRCDQCHVLFTRE